MEPELKMDAQAVLDAIDRLERTNAQLDTLKTSSAASGDAGQTAEFDETRLRLQEQVDKDREDVAKALAVYAEDLDKRLGDSLLAEMKTFEFFDSEGSSLGDAAKLTDVDGVRLKAQSVDDSIQKLLGMISIRHIKEEMDSQQYRNRIEDQFKRIHEKSHDLARSICKVQAADGIVQTAKVELEKFKNTAFTDRLADLPEARKGLDRIERKLVAIDNMLTSVRDLAGVDLMAFCGDENRAYVRYVTREVATRAEKPAFLSALVFSSGALAFAIAETAIAQSHSLFLMENRAAIVATSVVVTLMLSTKFGGTFRRGRVEKLQRRMRERLADLAALKSKDERNGVRKGWLTRIYAAALMLNPRALIARFFRVGDHDYPTSSVFPTYDLAKFRRARVNNTKNGATPRFDVRLTSDRREVRHRKIAMVAKNLTLLAGIYGCLALAWPYAATNLVTLNPVEAGKILIGSNSAGAYCILETGEITRIGANFVRVVTPGARLVDIDRDRIQQVEPIRIGQASGARMLDRCDADQGRAPKIAEVLTQNWQFLPNMQFQDRPGGTAEVGMSRLSDSIDALRSTLDERPAPQVIPLLLSAPQPGAPTEFLSVSIFLDGHETPVLHDRNAMLLPLFPVPVRNLVGRGPEGAYDYGRRSLEASKGRALIARQFLDLTLPRIIQCVQGGGTVDLDVVGYASQSWSQPNGDDPSLLNLYLAEGRRAAVLDRLWNSIPPGKTDFAERIRIVSADGKPVSLAIAMAGARPAFRFQTKAGALEPSLMTEHLAQYVADPDGQTLGADIRELLSRSVLIRVAGANGPSCASLPSPGKDPSNVLKRDAEINSQSANLE